MSTRTKLRLLSGAASITVTLVSNACSGGGSGTTPVTPTTPTTTVEVPDKGGTLVIAGSGEPTCADPLARCGDFLTAVLEMYEHTIPRAFDFIDGAYRPGALLAGEPTLEAGPPQRVTYGINPKAVWSDGVPITSSDFRYTWDQTLNGKDIAARTGYEQIASVDDSDPRTAVVTFKEPYAAWKSLFSRRGPLPKHLLDGKDRTAETRDGYRWSGGPWIIDHWTRGQEIKLVPNPNWWGAKPNLDAVVWKTIPDATAALAAYKSGQVSYTDRTPAEASTAELRALPDTKVEVAIDFGFNYIQFNVERPPFDRVAVRQALAYATDRDAFVGQIFGQQQPDLKALQSFSTPAAGPLYGDSFKRYRRDLTQVDRLMRGEGWAKGPDGIWAKDDQRAKFQLDFNAGSSQLVLGQQILQSQWREAGFDVTTAGLTVNALNDARTKGTYQVHLPGISASDDPNRCAQFCARNIPSPENGNQGSNTSRIADPALDQAWARVASELDPAKQLAALHQANDLLADLVPAIPTGPNLNVIVYNTSRLAGPIRVNPGPISLFFNLNEWWCRGGRCM